MRRRCLRGPDLCWEENDGTTARNGQTLLASGLAGERCSLRSARRARDANDCLRRGISAALPPLPAALARTPLTIYVVESTNSGYVQVQCFATADGRSQRPF